MAKIVSAYAVPHTPSFVAEQHGHAPTTGAIEFFGRIADHFGRVKPDILVMIQNDHFNTFFLDNWPTFAIGLASDAAGPSDQTPDMPPYKLRLNVDLAQHIHNSCVRAEFDLASSQELSLDHAVLVPLHFMMPEMQLPIVPIYVNCLVPPLPTASRCHLLGKAIGAAIRAWRSDKRIAVIASGSLSLEVGGPRIEPGKTFGVPDKAWASWVLEKVTSGQIDNLVAASSPERMFAAGNVGGEVLNWITLMGAVGTPSPDLIIEQPDLGNAFVAWTGIDHE